ncbi:hypothetical protein EBR25_01255 [bacterium]|nr:hypothetical protein [bacterium]
MNSSTWLISLADLLTLLLAAVIMGWCLQGEVPAITQVSEIADKLQSEGVGTHIARSFPETSTKMLLLYEEHFQEGGRELAELLKSLRASSDKCLESCTLLIEVSACAEDSGGHVTEVRHAALERLLIIHRHLFDGNGVRNERVRLASMGTECRALRFSEGGQPANSPVAIIRLRKVEEKG